MLVDVESVNEYDHQIEFGFLFPPVFDEQKQQNFIHTFNSSDYFSNFKYVEEHQNFTNWRDYYDYHDYDDDTVNEETTTTPTDTDSLPTASSNNTTETLMEKRSEETSNENTTVENKDGDENEIANENEITNDNENENEQGYRKLEPLFEYKIKIFNNENEIENEKKNTYDQQLYVIQFSSLTEYTIRYNYYKSQELYENIKDLEMMNDPYYYDMLDHLYPVQTMVNKGIIKMLAPNSQDFRISHTVLDRQGSKNGLTINMVNEVLSLCMLFYFVPCICNLLVFLVIEKESKIKESLVIIGLKKSSFWVSWALIYGLIVLLSSVMVTLVMVFYSSLYQFIHWSILILSMVIFGLTCCCISFILSTLIRKSKLANTVSVMIIVVFFAMYFLNMYVKNIPTLYTICLYTLSPISFLSLYDQLGIYNNQNIYIGFLKLFKIASIRNCFFGLICTLILYFFIAIYLDNVLPQGNNFNKKWHFFITDCFKGKKKSKSVDSNQSKNTTNPYIQEDPEEGKKAVEIKNIGKIFTVKGEKIEILKNINFNTYYNEIFAILGHNGAGKTTLMNIMTGILSSTHGDVYYDGVSISGNETEICKQFGYCPQFDTFNNNLTVGEHVKLFSGIKGIKVDVEDTLKSIDLLNKKDNFPKELSGGQRRKLCITLALLGSPKYVFLDEPTTGLDPYSRKNIWELLLSKKEGCVIFVTTHYMDEADLLADRKMIISNGNISCLGTSLFLKQQFNMNYSLDILCKDANDSLLTDNILEQFCPGTSKTKTISHSNMQSLEGDDDSENSEKTESGEYLITYLLPMKYSKVFKHIFEYINVLIKDNGNTIENFSLTSPTLEELFIKLENRDESHLQHQKMTDTATIDLSSDSNGLVEKLDPVFGKTSINKSSSLRQIFTIVKLRLKLFVRNKTFAFIYTLLPVALSLLCIYLVGLITKEFYELKTYKPLTLSTSLYDNEKWFKEVNTTSPALDYINIIQSSNHLNMDTISYANDIALSSGKDISNLNYVGGFSGYTAENQVLHFTLSKNVTTTYAIPIAINLLSNAILEKNGVKNRISTELHPNDVYLYEEYNESDENKLFNVSPERHRAEYESVLIIGLSLCISLTISVFGPYTVKEREEGITHQLFLNGTKRINYWLGVLISDGICISIPIAIITLAGYLNDISIFHPKVILFTISMSVMWIIGCLLQQYVFSYFFKKYDRISTILVILNPMISLLIGITVIMLASGEKLVIFKDINQVTDEYTRYELRKAKIRLYEIYMFILLFVPGSIIVYYGKLSSFLINKLINFTDEEVSEFLRSDKAKSINADSHLSNDEKSRLLKEAFFNPRRASIHEVFSCIDKFIYLVIIAVATIIIYSTLLFILEKVHQRRLRKNKAYTEMERTLKDKIIENGPIDVCNEYKRVGQSLKDDHSPIVLKAFQLSKDFIMKEKELDKKRKEEMKKENEIMGIMEKGKKEKKKDKKEKNKRNRNAFEKMDNRLMYDEKKKRYINRIVDDVTFGVNMSECLGLLGPNGAGKTTSISMITGLLSHTHGTIKYGEKDLNETDMANLSLGYCSQHNSLWKLLTVKETIEFYLNICGYPRQDIPRYTKALIEACGIENHTNKKVNEISGGTKRKLSLIIAICSSPSYLILDEPSAGMDPFTRRYMWKLISELKKVRETATILTTHSTEEAEALCDRIAILIKGRLVCIDTPRSIKINHSNSYTLEVFTSNPEQFEEELVKKQNLFGLDSIEDGYEVESSMSYQKYSVQMKTENIARVFALMELAQERQLVSQYNFGQFSLEQVFINFVNNSE